MAGSKATRKEWIGLAVIALPSMLYSMDLTVLYLAVPSLTQDLHPSAAQLLWITDIYGFLIAGLLVTMGTLGDRIGRRRLLMLGAAGFGAASVLAAFATSAEMLIAARALLGIAGATLAPSTLSLIRSMFHDSGQRSVAIGLWVTSYSAGAAIGPLVGGLLLERFWWGSVFLIAVPVMVLLLAVGPRLLPEFRDPSPGRFDLPSAALSLVSVLAVVYGVKRIAEGEVGAQPTLAIALGLAVGAVFVHRQGRLADPMIDLRLFRSPVFSAALGANSLGIFVVFGIDLFVAQYLQLVLGMGPFEAGLWTLPAAIGFIVGSNLAPPLAARISTGTVVAGGAAVAAIGLGLLTQVGTESGLATLSMGSVLMALGAAQLVTLGTDLVVGAAPPERAGAASAVSETGAELGGALGIALLGSIGTAVFRSEASGASIATAPEAFTHGMQLAALASVVLMVAVATIAARVLREHDRDAPLAAAVPCN